jgi:erythromycin esterase
MERMPVPDAVGRSWDSFLHNLANKGRNKLLTFPDADKENELPPESKGQRAIGVVYNPAYEKYGNYIETIMSARYDAFLFIDETHALHSLHMPRSIDEPPETYPTGL